jgi:hypothetical protein
MDQKESIKKQINQILSQMIELKQSADQMENKLYMYLQAMLSQLKSIYTSKSRQLKANYQELLKKEQLINYHQTFIQDSSKVQDKIDFLNQWEVFQKIHYSIFNMRLQMKSVETANLTDSLDFETPSGKIFENSKVAEQIQRGFGEFHGVGGPN